jgi:SIR2-like domain
MGCVEIPSGERLNQLQEPLSSKHYDSSKLTSLVNLPFDFIVTTNYDRAIHDACTAVRKVAKPAELNDTTLAHALYWEDFFVARIHGRAELPASIILDSVGYKSLDGNAEYNDFLHQTFNRRSCLFVGFSFLDPAIEKILNFIAEKGVYPRKHYALVPLSKDPLAERMSKYNIEVLQYDDSGAHKLLWQCFDALTAKPPTVREKPKTIPLFDTTRRLLAVCYAGAEMGSEGVALRHLVVQGIILSALDKGIDSVAALDGELRKFMAIGNKEAETLTADALTALTEKQLCLRDGDNVVLVEDISDKVSASPAQRLAKGIVDRLFVRNGLEVNAEISDAIARVAEEVLVLRGFDLGAEFAGAEPWSELDPTPTIEAAIHRQLPNYWQDKRHLISTAFIDLLRRPEPEEELVLAELGRLSFGIEVVLRAGRSTMYALSLPEIVYLDANVLMPAIVAGHPYRSLYMDAIRKVQRASRQGSRPTRVVVADVFLEEVVKHREIAIALVRELGLENLESLRKPITFYGSEDVNVFIGAYSTWLVQKEGSSDTSFKTFLAEAAPYSNQKELEEFLERIGIEVISTKATSQAEVRAYADSAERLLDSYRSLEISDPRYKGKATVLKKHEGRQVRILQQDSANGVRSVFTTADYRLRKAVALGGFGQIGDLLFSHRNLVQLVDLLIGLEMDPSSLTRLIWTVQIADDRAALREYLINRALRHYDAAMLLKMNDLLDRYVDKTLHEAKLENIDLLSKRTKGRVKTTLFLDRAEKDLFEELAQEVKKLKEELKSVRG